MAYVISRNNLIKGGEVWAPPCTNCVCGYHFQPGNHNLHNLKACAFNFHSSCGFIRPRNAKAVRNSTPGHFVIFFNKLRQNKKWRHNNAYHENILRMSSKCSHKRKSHRKSMQWFRQMQRGKQAQRPDCHGLIKKKKHRF